MYLCSAFFFHRFSFWFNRGISIPRFYFVIPPILCNFIFKIDRERHDIRLFTPTINFDRGVFYSHIIINFDKPTKIK